MHKKRKLRQKSVAVQSTGLFDSEADGGAQVARLCKKAGFRNLLQKSMTVGSREDEEDESYYFPGGKKSKSVQTASERDHHPYRSSRFLRDGRSMDFSSGKDHDSGRTASEMMGLTDRGAGSSKPGPSTGITSLSALSQVNEMHARSREGSLAVVYSFEEKALESSRSSNLAFIYGSQGSRRFSDETVLLIEDYQSYDYLNAAGRLDSDFNRRRSAMTCCNRSKRSSPDLLIRPVPLEFEGIQETDESMVCRICHEGEDVEPLIQPCLCKGSVGNVHARCLKIWLEQSNTSRCELCNYPYAIRQTKKYPKCLSIKVFYQTVVHRRALAYDVVSFVIITPLTLVGVAMCIQASLYSSVGEGETDANHQMGNITKAGMIMLSGTIAIAYGVWLYTLISYHVKSWKKWYSNAFDVEVIPVRMSSEERIEAARRLSEEMNRRQLSGERDSALLTILHSPNPTVYNTLQRRVSASPDALPTQVSPAVHR